MNGSLRSHVSNEIARDYPVRGKFDSSAGDGSCNSEYVATDVLNLTAVQWRRCGSRPCRRGGHLLVRGCAWRRSVDGVASCDVACRGAGLAACDRGRLCKLVNNLKSTLGKSMPRAWLNRLFVHQIIAEVMLILPEQSHTIISGHSACFRRSVRRPNINILGTPACQAWVATMSSINRKLNCGRFMAGFPRGE